MEDSVRFNDSFTLPGGSSFFSSAFPNAHMQNIGCTVAVHQPNQPIVLQSFFNMPVSTTLLAERSGAFSLYLDTLIIAMRTHVFCSPAGSVKPLINALLHNQPLNELVSGSNTVTIATCRIPNFSNVSSIQNSGVGYVQLPGSLDQLLLYAPDSSHFMDFGRELLSIGSILQENTEVKAFFDIWQPFGIQLDFHFILLFLLRPVHPATIGFNSFLFSSPSATSSSIPLFQSVCSSISNPWVPATLSHMASTSTNTTCSLGCSSPIAASNFSQALTEKEIFDSRYEGKKRGIVAQVKNWRAMKNVLGKLSAVSDEDRHAVLEEFGWSAMTFRNKSLWYEWAFEAARKTWRGERSAVRYEREQGYRQWRGIVYLFKPSGAIDRNHVPKATSGDREERWAAEVTQAKMDSMRTAISAHLG